MHVRPALSLLLVLSVALAGCAGLSMADLAAASGVGGGASSAPTGPVAPPALSGSASECYQGTWALDAASAWTPENLRRMGVGDGTLEYVRSSGDAWLTLQPDARGTYVWTLNDFSVTLRGRQSDGSTQLTTVNMHGQIWGTARGSGPRTLAMVLQPAGVPATQLGVSAEVTVPGAAPIRIPLTVSRFFGTNSWTSSYRCGGATLSLTGQNDTGGALQNATYRKVR